jgi:hypothetical protein
MENDKVCLPQEREPEVSHILRWFLWWLLLTYIVVCLELCICYNVSSWRRVLVL